MGRNITKVGFKAAGEGGVKIGYETFDSNGPKDETSKNSKHVPHSTFKEALQKLKGHMLIINEFIPTAKIKKYSDLKLDEQLEESYRVVGVTVSGSGTEKEGIIITGYKTLSNGLGFVFNTPNTRVENEGESAYPHIAELLEDVERVKNEADDYLKGKYGVKQGELFENPGEEDGE
jgi:hypothetical protein